MPPSVPLMHRIRRVFPAAHVIVKALGLVYSGRSYLRTTGYLRSVREGRPCRADGTPLPWMNYDVIGFLEQRLRREHTLFEFGSGHSTRFFANRVGSVTSVESNPDWHALISRELPTNARVILCQPFSAARYVATLAEQNRRFDVIVVDAEEREACLEVVWQYLTPGGVILLDDAARPRYASAIERLLGRGFRFLSFEGLKPGGLRGYRTTIFYRDGNVLGI